MPFLDNGVYSFIHCIQTLSLDTFYSLPFFYYFPFFLTIYSLLVANKNLRSESFRLLFAAIAFQHNTRLPNSNKTGGDYVTD